MLGGRAVKIHPLLKSMAVIILARASIAYYRMKSNKGRRGLLASQSVKLEFALGLRVDLFTSRISGGFLLFRLLVLSETTAQAFFSC